MLRGQPHFALTAKSGTSTIPSSTSAFTSEPERSAGIRFYRAKESFFLPYSNLQAIHWFGEHLKLTFTHDEVEIEGQGLHALYVELTEFKVARVQQQDESSNDNASVHITRINRQPRE